MDEHCYDHPLWFFTNTTRYDHYDRNGPKVFMGEYAAQSVDVVSPKNRNNLECALAEAAYLTGLERNADVVRMASYAPLFANADAWQWTPDLIWVDSLSVYGTPSYYVQQLFSRNRGDAVLPVALSGAEAPPAQSSGFTPAPPAMGRAMKSFLKSSMPEPAPRRRKSCLPGWTRWLPTAKAMVLAGANLGDVNSFDEPHKIAPVESQFHPGGARFPWTFAGHSLTVLRVGGE